MATITQIQHAQQTTHVRLTMPVVEAHGISETVTAQFNVFADALHEAVAAPITDAAHLKPAGGAGVDSRVHEVACKQTSVMADKEPAARARDERELLQLVSCLKPMTVGSAAEDAARTYGTVMNEFCDIADRFQGNNDRLSSHLEDWCTNTCGIYVEIDSMLPRGSSAHDESIEMAMQAQVKKLFTAVLVNPLNNRTTLEDPIIASGRVWEKREFLEYCSLCDSDIPLSPYDGLPFEDVRSHDFAKAMIDLANRPPFAASTETRHFSMAEDVFTLALSAAPSAIVMTAPMSSAMRQIKLLQYRNKAMSALSAERSADLLLKVAARLEMGKAIVLAGEISTKEAVAEAKRVIEEYRADMDRRLLAVERTAAETREVFETRCAAYEERIRAAEEKAELSRKDKEAISRDVEAAKAENRNLLARIADMQPRKKKRAWYKF